MGTTTSALVIRDGQGWFGHVGDSRIYLVRGDEIRQLTDDHSLVASMVREGLLTSKEAETHPRRNVLQRSMGVAEQVDIDVRGPLDVQEGDTYILCSDGLHGVVKEPELKEVAKLSIDRAADEFVKLAMERGAPDNVTVIVARVVRSIDGDDTVVDRPRAAAVAEALDETQRDTDRIPIIPPEESSAIPSEIVAPDPPAVEIFGDDTVETKKPEPEPEATPTPAPGGGGTLKWFLLAAAAIGAASAWFFLSR
jgi:hypothetical protein